MQSLSFYGPFLEIVIQSTLTVSETPAFPLPAFAGTIFCGNGRRHVFFLLDALNKAFSNQRTPNGHSTPIVPETHPIAKNILHVILVVSAVGGWFVR